MRDSRRLQERVEVRLERMQLMWLTLGVIVALGVVFALGILVGKRAARLAPALAVADPIAQIDRNGDLHEELTFYDKLTAPGASARGRAVAQAAPGTPAARPSAPEPTAPAAPPERTALASALVSVAQAAAPGATQPAAASTAGEPSAAASGADSEVLAGLARGPARPGEYTVQVSSFQTSEEAKAFAASLERKGYRPFVVAAEVKGRGTWYRVRLGSFRDPERARSAKLLLARSDIPAWVLRSE